MARGCRSFGFAAKPSLFLRRALSDRAFVFSIKQAGSIPA
jgi:hypothetical protein